jgi:hypothetical protein
MRPSDPRSCFAEPPERVRMGAPTRNANALTATFVGACGAAAGSLGASSTD